MSDHEIITRHKIENIYVETEDKMLVGESVKSLYYIKKLQVEYEQFYCKKTRKLITLENWDFEYCPFCGKEIEK